MPSAATPAVRLHGSRRRRVCSAPPWGRLGYICEKRFRICETEPEIRFRKCRNQNPESVSTYVEKGSELRPEPSEPFPNLPNLFVELFVQPRPLNWPWRQVVFAASWHNCRPSRQSGGCAPRPPLMPKGSGFGVRDSRGETRYSEPCGFGMSPLAPSQSQLFSMFWHGVPKKWEPFGSQSGQGKRCGNTVAVLTPPSQHG